MDTSEVSLECERMEQTDASCANSRPEESVWQKTVTLLAAGCFLPVQCLHSTRELFGEALCNTPVPVLA
jgi:hypothetical protein